MLKNPKFKYGNTDLTITASLHFGDMLMEKLLLHKDNVAFINAVTNEEVTYDEIGQNALDFSVSLRQLGLSQGDVVAVISENRREFWGTVAGTVYAGGVITPINILFTPAEFKHVLSISKPKYIVCSPIAYKLHAKSIKSLPFIEKVILFGDEEASNTTLFKKLVNKGVKADEVRAVDVKGQKDPVVILYSSGTTGLPKGVVLTHHNALVTCSIMVNQASPATARTVMIAPWYHAMGFWGTLGGISNGRTSVYMPKFEERLFLATIQKYQITLLTVVPPILVMLSKSQIMQEYDVSSVLAIFSGAAPIDLDTIRDVKKRFPNLTGVYQGYGMTESTLAITREMPLDPNGFKEGSVGKTMAYGIVKVVDIESRQPLGPRQHGELCVKGPIVMDRYIGKDSRDDFDSEGFFKTGDIGYYDEEGFFFIVDRLKELIKYKGYQVPPAEIEAELLQHPAVRDAGVVGVPNRAAGEVPLAFVVKLPGMDVDETQIKEFIAKKLSNPKHLRGGVKFVEQIPKNPSGKILRRELRKWVKTGHSKL